MSGRLPPLPRREALPLALLALALSSVFVFGNDRSQFYRPGHHDYVSAQGLALASNLSAEHGFAGFFRREPDGDGEPRYVVYNRFPAGPTVLVKLAILPFGDDIPRQIGAARLLMLAFFAAAAAMAYLALARLLGDRRIALAATLFACSSYYCLYYNDMISAEIGTNLFGVMLTFHGMAVFAQDGRFRQLLVKTAVALPLGWHAAGLVAPFVLLGLAGELRRARADGRLPARAALAALARSRYLACGAFAALCCALVLGFNLGVEYRALGGEVPPHELPTVRSVLSRAGADAAYTGAFGWLTFLRGQLGGVAGSAIPFVLVDGFGLGLSQPHHGLWPPESAAPRFAAAGAAVGAVCLAGLRWLPHRMLFASLLLGGWAWAIPFRGTAALHEFDAVFHIGFPLVLCALALTALRRAIGRERARRALPALALAALALFALSAQRMGGVGHDAAAAERQREVAADLRAIRGIAAGGSVAVRPIDYALAPGNPANPRLRDYWLAGLLMHTEPLDAAAGADAPADYAVLFGRFGGSLTPDNRRVHLYRFSALPDVLAALAAREPALRAAFDVHLDGRTLAWVRDPCGGDDIALPFFLHVFPAGDRGPRPHRELTFAFGDSGLRHGGACLGAIDLPDYPAAAVRIGQYDDGGPVWEGKFPLDPGAWLGRYAAVADSEPALRAPFDVHLDGRTLHYLREECSAADAAARFFLHVTPLDADDLPADRREAGFGNLDFAFGDRGLRYGGRCMASAELPDYPAARVRTGQHEGGERLWEGEFALPAGE